MPDIVIHAVTAAGYAGLAWHFWNSRWRAQPAGTAAPGGGLRPWERAAILAPLALHGWLLHAALFAGELRFGFAHALSAMLWLAVLLCWIENLFLRIAAIYPIALAAAAVCAPLTAFFAGRASAGAISPAFSLHLLFGMLAYSLFMVATMHAVLISMLDRQLHGHRPGPHPPSGALLDDPMQGLPPLLSLERVVFQLTGAAFLVLTLTIAVGIAYSESIFGRAMRFDHKTVFVVLSWLTFGLLLAGRRLYGWRGRAAWRWTFAGFALLLLAYPGSRFVMEVLLGRS